MPYDLCKHHRRSIRLRGYDYTAPGAYFITIDTHAGLCLFGEIINGVMRLTEYGEIAYAEWLKTPSIRPEIVLDEFQFMPDHFHAIVIIMDGGGSVGAHGNAPDATHGNAPDAAHGNGAHSRAPIRMDGGDSVGAHGNAPDATHGNAPDAAPMALNEGDFKRAHSRAPLRRSARSLGTLIGGYKSAVTTRINRIRRTPGVTIWQRNFYEHIVRDNDDLTRIREYIRNNPLQWDIDEMNK